MAAKKKSAAKKGAGKKTAAGAAAARKPASKASVKKKAPAKAQLAKAAAKAGRGSATRGKALARLATSREPGVLATAGAAAALAQDQVIRFFNVPDGSRVQLRVETDGNVILAAELLENGQIVARFDDAAVRAGAVRFTVSSPDIYTFILTATFVSTGSVRGEVAVTPPGGSTKSKTFTLSGEAGDVDQATITIVTQA